MDIRINIEQFDNGLTLRWRDMSGGCDDYAIVIPEHSINQEVGRIIMRDVKTVMDAHSENKVTLTIKIESDETK